jgi:hypothetical protein
MAMPEHPWPEGIDPPFGREVVATLEDGSKVLVMRVQGKWVVGVDNDPVDAELQGRVISWRFRDIGE